MGFELLFGVARALKRQGNSVLNRSSSSCTKPDITYSRFLLASVSDRHGSIRAPASLCARVSLRTGFGLLLFRLALLGSKLPFGRVSGRQPHVQIRKLRM